MPRLEGPRHFCRHTIQFSRTERERTSPHPSGTFHRRTTPPLSVRRRSQAEGSFKSLPSACQHFSSLSLSTDRAGDARAFARHISRLRDFRFPVRRLPFPAGPPSRREGSFRSPPSVCQQLFFRSLSTDRAGDARAFARHISRLRGFWFPVGRLLSR
jgi:hypothetical protein